MRESAAALPVAGTDLLARTPPAADRAGEILQPGPRWPLLLLCAAAMVLVVCGFAAPVIVVFPPAVPVDLTQPLVMGAGPAVVVMVIGPGRRHLHRDRPPAPLTGGSWSPACSSAARQASSSPSPSDSAKRG